MYHLRTYSVTLKKSLNLNSTSKSSMRKKTDWKSFIAVIGFLDTITWKIIKAISSI